MRNLNFLALIVILISAVIFTSCESQPPAPKNIIVLISDGCGFNQVEATSFYEHGKTGMQVYEQFPVTLACTTYPAHSVGYNPDSVWASFDYVRIKPTDSAASGTAIATGVKTYNGALGVDTLKKPVENIVERMENEGKSSGVVSSVFFSHATPAAFLAHNESRSNYAAIAESMVLDSRAEVIMGCGHPWYGDSGEMISDTTWKFVGGPDLWQAMNEGGVGGDADGDGHDDPWKLIMDRSEFQALAEGNTPERIIGVAKVAATLQQKRKGDVNAEPYAVPFNENVPTLAEMTRGALNVLDNNRRGFFLMIEGGAVDWSGHANQSGRLIEEQAGFNEAVEAVVGWVEQNSNWDETLVVVTSDHETGYLTGPGSDPKNQTADAITEIWQPIRNNGKGELPGMEWHSGGHTNSLVPFYAKGRGSERFAQHVRGTDPVRGPYIDNTGIGKVMLSFYGSQK